MIRDFAPKSLFGRTILIVILPLFLMQSVVTWVFFNRHWEEVTSTLAEQTASDLGLLVRLWEEDSDVVARTNLVMKAREELSIDMGHIPGGVIPEEDQGSIFDALNRTLDRELDWSLDVPYWYDTTGFAGTVETRVQLADGYLVFSFDRERVVAQNGHFFVLWLIGATLLLGYIALIFLRNQVRSITRLAAAAEAFGRGEDVRGFKPAGAREVRQAGHAFIAMRARIKRFLAQRTEMLAGVSHDLKTPLTRMKLNLALRDQSEDNDELHDDIREMEGLLTDYLTFARGEAETFRETVPIPELGDDLARSAKRQGRSLALDIEPNTTLVAQRSALHRALSNLIENGFNVAETVHLTARTKDAYVEFFVDDNGPGIPVDEREAATKAFSRLDQARNSNDAGSGLGLAIVRDVARAHGGTLTLGEAPIGGLRATLRIPVASEEPGSAGPDA